MAMAGRVGEFSTAWWLCAWASSTTRTGSLTAARFGIPTDDQAGEAANDQAREAADLANLFESDELVMMGISSSLSQ
jgi:hypothetical protein